MSFVNNAGDTLIVPNKLVPSFQDALIPNPQSLIEYPRSPSKIKRFFRKTSIITGPVTALASGGTFLSLMAAMPTLDNPFALWGIAFSTGFGIFAGGTLTSKALLSIETGDGKFSLQGPSKDFLAIEESKKQKAIAPFNQWDAIFAANNKQD